MTTKPYNPLDKINLARSIEIELLARPPVPLASVEAITGAGIYVIYYSGSDPAYEQIRARPEEDGFERPIYIGKAIPKGGRKGGLTKDAGVGAALRDRLRQHATSIKEATNLDLNDFWVRNLVVDDIWIPLGENMLIETFKPVWNRAIDGFGNKTPGVRRVTQFRSPWDVLHPGRSFATNLGESGLTEEFLRERVADYFANRPLKRLPKQIEAALREQESEESGDEA